MPLPSMDTARLLHTPGSGATLPEPGAAPGRPVRVGPYELLERIGRGGLGDVYRARHTTVPGPDVALKLLRAGDAASPDELRSFARECEVARRLDHPNILPILEDGVHDGQPFYAMPLAPGGSLEKRLRTGRVDCRRGVALLVRVARAVHHAHGRLVLHRDLKPANILLGAGDEPLVADFGLAKCLDHTSGHTMSGQLMGSLPYMSPEQAGGQSHRATPATDVWSLGVILYEVLTGRRPFLGGGPTEVLRRIQHSAPPSPRLVRPDVPAELEAVCLAALHKEPTRRCQSAAELADRLQGWLDGQPAAERPVELPRWRRALAAALGALALLAGLLLLPAPADRPPPRAESQRQADARARLVRTRPGAALPLLLAGQAPPWHRLALGEDAAKMTVRRGQPLWLHTPSVVLLEVVPPDGRRGSFRLVVELCQCDGEAVSFVGLYAGRVAVAHARGTGHTLVQATFCETLLERPGAPPADPAALLRTAYYNEPRQGAIRPSRFVLPVPSAPLPSTWDHQRLPGRTLRLEVRPDSVTLLADNQPARVAQRPEMLRFFRIGLKMYPELRQHEPNFGPAGGAGIVVGRGTVLVRRLLYEPL